MSNKSDVIHLDLLRCPECRGMVVSVWNLKTTDQVRCINKECKEYGVAIEPMDCIDVSKDEEDMIGIEDLDDVMEVGK